MVDVFFSTLQEIYNFLTKSTGLFGKLRSGIEMLQKELIMKNLCKTRWIGKAESIRVMWVNYKTLNETLIDVKSWEDGDRDARRTTMNLLDRIKSFEYYLSLLFMKSVMYINNIIHKCLYFCWITLSAT